MNKLLVLLALILPLHSHAGFVPMVNGDLRFESDCQLNEKAMLERAMVLARASAGSYVFQQCVSDAVEKAEGAEFAGLPKIGPYLACKTDPYATGSKDTQILGVLTVMRGNNVVANKCTGGKGGNAEAVLGKYRHGNPEFMTWSGWLRNVAGSLGLRYCRPGDNAACQFAPYPWPYSQAAGIMMHEISHTHGYDHGANTQADAPAACGITNPSWHYMKNTLPYIIGQCIEAHINASAVKCGRTEGCGPGMVRLLAGMKGACSCQPDPRGPQNIEPEPIGQTLYVQMAKKSGESHYGYDVHARDGQGIGDWTLTRDDLVHGSADIVGKLGNNLEELVVTGTKGLGLIGIDSFGIMKSLYVYPNGTNIRLPNRGSPGVLDTKTMKIIAMGDFDGNGKEDFIFRYPGGIVMVGVFEVGLGTIGHVRFGEKNGNWVVAESDVIAGRVRKAGTDAFVLRSAWGISLLEYNGKSTDTKIVNPVQFGTRLAGGWIVGDIDRIQAGGDFTGDGLDEVFVRSPWGIGLLQAPQTDEGAWTTRWAVPFGTALPGGWVLDSKDRYSVSRSSKGTGRQVMAQSPKAGVGFLRFENNNFTKWMDAPMGLEIGRGFAIRDSLISGGGYDNVWSLHDGKNGALINVKPGGVHAITFMTTPNTRVLGVGKLQAMKPGDVETQVISTDM